MNKSIVGVLYIVASPIGNLQDITYRAVNILRDSDLILVEDTRRSRILCRTYDINTRFKVLNEHNEQQQVDIVLSLLAQGQNISLLSDAGTPLISDPGYRLVAAAQKQGVKIVPIPGSCAAIAALSVSGLATDKFIFEGFLPTKSAARKLILSEFHNETRTVIFYEAPHRILATLNDMLSCFGPSRIAVLARELTKVYESIYLGSIENLISWIENNKEQQKGEMVLLISGKKPEEISEISQQEAKILQTLLEEFPLKQAVHLTSKLTGARKNMIYKYAISFLEV